MTPPDAGVGSFGSGGGAEVVLAAGGVVWRWQNGGLEVILVHRPRYDDWSIPKGKLDPGETDEQAALREVLEEASVEAVIGPELPGTTYLDKSGRTKRVRYFAMTAKVGETPVGAHEVDVAGWFPLDAARSRLSYARDIIVLNALPPLVG